MEVRFVAPRRVVRTDDEGMAAGRESARRERDQRLDIPTCSNRFQKVTASSDGAAAPAWSHRPLDKPFADRPAAGCGKPLPCKLDLERGDLHTGGVETGLPREQDEAPEAGAHVQDARAGCEQRVTTPSPYSATG